MDCFNHAWLGFAPTPESAVKTITETGVFYLTISIAYALSFLHTLGHASLPKKIKKNHIFGISLWALCGGSLVLYPAAFSLVLNGFIVGISLFVLYQLYYLSPLAAHATLAPPTDDKKRLYARTLLEKAGYSLSDMLQNSVINEQILWLLILYRAAITVRASLAL